MLSMETVPMLWHRAKTRIKTMATGMQTNPFRPVARSRKGTTIPPIMVPKMGLLQTGWSCWENYTFSPFIYQLRSFRLPVSLRDSA